MEEKNDPLREALEQHANDFNRAYHEAGKAVSIPKKPFAGKSLQNNVWDLSAEGLIERAVRNAGINCNERGKPYWAAVQGVFGLGSTYARELCWLYDVDPDRIVNPQGEEG